MYLEKVNIKVIGTKYSSNDKEKKVQYYQSLNLMMALTLKS